MSIRKFITPVFIYAFKNKNWLIGENGFYEWEGRKGSILPALNALAPMLFGVHGHYKSTATYPADLLGPPIYSKEKSTWTICGPLSV
jgi:hypothetical protein